MKSNFENSGNIMPKHISHEGIRIFTIAHIK